MYICMWRKEERTLSPNRDGPKNERVTTEPKTSVTFIIFSFIKKDFLGLEIDKTVGPKN